MRPKALTRPWSRPREIRTKMEDRPASDPKYHTRRWTKESAAFKASHPLCEECSRHGRITPAEVTDHIIPVGYHDFWDQANWQALCRKCNIIKGNRDKITYSRGRGV